MRTLSIIAFALIIAGCNSSGKTTGTADYVITNVSVIPMDKEEVITGQDVFIADGKITTIAATGKNKIADNATVIDGNGKFLIPGMAEMHAHIPTFDDTTAMKNVLELFALKGVTTIRGMLGHPTHLILRDQLKSEAFFGPRFYAAAPGLMGSTVKSEKDADSLVRKYKNEGYDLLKLLPGLTLQNFNAVVKTAKEVGIPFAGHVSYDVGVWNAIDAGYASIDHLDGFVEALVPGIEKIPGNQIGLFALHIADKADETRIDTLVKALKSKNVWVVPTECLPERWFTPLKSAEAFSQDPEMVYMHESTLNNWIRGKKDIMSDPSYDSAKVVQLLKLRKKIIKACHDNGVGLVAGSDAPQVFDVPGFSLHQELKYMTDAGLTPYEVLKTATVNAAEYFDRSNAGVVKEGAPAELVLLNANPLTDISNVGSIAGVIIGKTYLSEQDIAGRLEALKGKVKQ